jgi:hypothetical protein
MASVWAQSVRRSLDDALELLGEVVSQCPDELWQRPMWPVRAAEIVGDVRDARGELVTEPVQREALVQRWSAPWSVACHALEVLDYDLVGELDRWAAPSPFTGRPHWQTFASLPVAFSRSQIRGYVEHCRQRVHDMFAGMTDDKAAALLPSPHRYQGKPYAWIVTGLVGHTTAHATQIRQFTTTFGSANAVG